MIPVLLLACSSPSDVTDCPAQVEAWADEDGDGFGGEALGTVCELAPGTVASGTDCDDGDPEVHPEAEERCNGLDDDCADGPDQGLAGSRILYTDADGDGVGAPYAAEFRCGRPRDDQVEEGGDCDDADPGVSPRASEVCNGFDDDCDYLVDDDDGSLDLDTRSDWYRDADADGYGTETPHRLRCRAPAGYADNPDDCAELDPFVHPGATEVVGDGVDQDCDTHDACYQDRDRDGFGSATVVASRGPTCTGVGEAEETGDCDDLDPTLGAPADWYADPDGDGFGAGPPVGYGCQPPTATDVAETGDCSPGDPTIHPGAHEVCDDAVDDDCDGSPSCCPLHTAAETATYPVAFGFDYCWGASSCPYVPPAGSTWNLEEDGTWWGSNYGGTWWIDEGSCELVVVYDTGTTYTGHVDGPGCLTGDMIATSGSLGTWSGCLQ